MPLIARVLDRARLDFAALDRIAVTIGPGSFTGLRVGIAAARGIALAAGKPAIGLSTLAAFAAPLIAADDTLPVVAAIDARHDHVYLQVFGPGGRTLVAPRIAPLREALRVSATGAPRIIGTAAQHAGGRMAGRRARRRAPSSSAPRARHRLGGAARRRRDRYRHAAEAALSARARCTAAGRCSIGPPMIGFISSLFTRGEPAMSEASARDAAAIAALHGASFRRGWSEQEVEGLLLDRHVIAHRARDGRNACRLHHVATGRGRGGNSFGCGCPPPARARPCAPTARSAFAPARRPWRAHRISGGRRAQRPGAPALPPRRISRSIPPPELLPRNWRFRSQLRWCCAAIWLERAIDSRLTGSI